MLKNIWGGPTLSLEGELEQVASHPKIARGIILKSPREIGLMREAGRLVHAVLSRTRELAVPGSTTAEFNAEAERMIADAEAEALFKGVEAPSAKFPFPAALCTSVNEVVVHGIPDHRPLNEGDIVSIDCGVRLNGYCGDAATTIAIGEVHSDVRQLLEVTIRMLDIAIEEIRPSRKWSQVAKKMQKHAEGHRFSVVRQFVGHGIGQQMHEDPKVPNYYDRTQAKHDFDLRPGMVLAVEPMVNMGTRAVRYRDQNEKWAVVTQDGRWAAHFEHTIAVTERGCEVLTSGE